MSNFVHESADEWVIFNENNSSATTLEQLLEQDLDFGSIDFDAIEKNAILFSTSQEPNFTSLSTPMHPILPLMEEQALNDDSIDSPMINKFDSAIRLLDQTYYEDEGCESDNETAAEDLDLIDLDFPNIVKEYCERTDVVIDEHDILHAPPPPPPPPPQPAPAPAPAPQPTPSPTPTVLPFFSISDKIPGPGAPIPVEKMKKKRSFFPNGIPTLPAKKSKNEQISRKISSESKTLKKKTHFQTVAFKKPKKFSTTTTTSKITKKDTINNDSSRLSIKSFNDTYFTEFTKIVLEKLENIQTQQKQLRGKISKIYKFLNESK